MAVQILFVHKGRISLRLPSGPFCGQHFCSPGGWRGLGTERGQCVHFYAISRAAKASSNAAPGGNSLHLALGSSLPSKALEEAPRAWCVHRHHFLTAQQSHLFSGAKAVPPPPALQLFSPLFIPGRLFFVFFSFFILSQQPAGNKGTQLLS